MANDNGGISDAVGHALVTDAPEGEPVMVGNEPTGPDVKGPDEAHWPVENRGEVVDNYEPTGPEGGPKGPDPAVWGDEARAERGADNAALDLSTPEDQPPANG